MCQRVLGAKSSPLNLPNSGPEVQEPFIPSCSDGNGLGHISTRVPWWSCKAATVLAGVLRPLASTQDVHARDALSDTGCSTKRKGTQGGILDQDVIHYDTWVRKHSWYAFTRLSARGLT